MNIATPAAARKSLFDSPAFKFWATNVSVDPGDPDLGGTRPPRCIGFTRKGTRCEATAKFGYHYSYAFSDWHAAGCPLPLCSNHGGR